MSSDSLERLWMRFGPETDPARGVAAAFALVACSDGRASDAELRRYAEFAATLPHSGVEDDVRRAAFDAVTRAILRDFDAGRQSVLAVLSRFKGDTAATETILRAAQIAIVADGADEIREEVALREVCEALGVDPGAY